MKAIFLTIPFALLGLGFQACSPSEPPKTDCGAVNASVTAHLEAGRVQSDGAVTIYGSISVTAPANEEHHSPAELTVRAVYVGGVEIQATGDGFNHRTWSVSIPVDRLRAHAVGDAGVARIPMVAYLYGGCRYELPEAEQPLITLPEDVDASSQADDAGVEAGADAGEEDSGDADAG